MEKLQQALAFGGILSKDDLARVLSHFRNKKLKAEAHFHSMHSIAREVAFVEMGILRVYSADLHGNEVTKFLIRENQFVVDLQSYYTATPGRDAIQAVVPSEIYTIQKLVLDRLIEEIPNLYIFLKSITEAHLLNKIRDNDFLNFGDARTKYLEFIKRYPEVASRIPQQYIASYLKITPQSLSRIRKELAGK
ncbi:Crp/Fnr family transcriptional regulator [Longitalea arenae]|uniref:Crp/Fnr family transcriptional regulator n=1 Tax=Longitalea arenae TaxID=2812558 RepID=UPI00196815EE|nr:Crp/Fnr family transcriptional regulator [Longitalea arenae]